MASSNSRQQSLVGNMLLSSRGTCKKPFMLIQVSCRIVYVLMVLTVNPRTVRPFRLRNFVRISLNFFLEW